MIENMFNSIVSRQNEEKSILLLAAQRQIYNEIKIINKLDIVLSIFIPLLLLIAQFFLKENIYLSNANLAFSIVSMIVGIMLRSFKTKQKKQAAEIQQEFDVYVYHMPWDDKLFGKKKDLDYLVAKKSKLLLDKDGERKKLIDWYTPSVGNVSHLKGIWMCQKENFYWDISLRNRFIRFCYIICFSVVTTLFLMGLINDESVRMLLNKIVVILPVLKWVCDTIKQLHDDIDNIYELDDLMYSSKRKTMYDLQIIQSKIFNHRKTCYDIPNVFYERYRDNDEDLAHRTAVIDNL